MLIFSQNKCYGNILEKTFILYKYVFWAALSSTNIGKKELVSFAGTSWHRRMGVIPCFVNIYPLLLPVWGERKHAIPNLKSFGTFSINSWYTCSVFGSWQWPTTFSQASFVYSCSTGSISFLNISITAHWGSINTFDDTFLMALLPHKYRPVRKPG